MYHFETYTGYKVDNAGTNANVYAVVVADSGVTSGKRALKKSLNDGLKFTVGKVRKYIDCKYECDY